MPTDDHHPDDPSEEEVSADHDDAGSEQAAASDEAAASAAGVTGAGTAVAGARTRNLAMLGVAIVAVLGMVAFVLAQDEDAPPPAPTTTTTTTTTTTSTTSTTVPVRPALVSQVATAKPEVQSVFIKEAPPEGWDTMEPAIVWEAPQLPVSQAEFTERPDLPRDDYDIQGRYKTEDGWEFHNPGPFDGPTSFLVTEQRGNWAEVMMPVRPNGTVGYIDINQVDMSEHDYRVELDISDRRLVAYQGTEVIADSQVVVGKDSTRTPTGRFYITDKTQDTPSSFFGPAMLPLNSYSEQLDLFDGGVPVIAMHGTTRPDLLGQAQSNGCVRMPNEIVSLLYDQLPVGTQVEIYA
ncbi:MAG: L,D-transpeptidase [Microthrixaceae bacterium]